MKPLLFLAMMTAACSWSKFDDLSDQTPVRATETPDGVSATSYGVSIVGATLPGETSGGKIAVLSSGPGNYSTLDLDPDGSSIDLGDNEKLGNHTIDSVTTKGVVLFDGVGQVALVDNSNVGTVVAVLGAPDALANDQQIPTALPPDTATFVGGLVWVGVTPTTASPANIAGNDGQNKFACQALDGALPTPMAVQPAAIALSADKAVLWVYAKTGGLFSYHVSDLEACGNAPTPVQVAPASATLKTTDTMAALPAAPNAGHLDLVVEGASTYAILTAYDSTSSATGFVDVFDITNAAGTDRDGRQRGRRAGRARCGVRHVRRHRHPRARLSEPRDREHVGRGRGRSPRIHGRRPQHRRGCHADDPEQRFESPVRPRGHDDPLQRQADRRRRCRQHGLQLLRDVAVRQTVVRDLPMPGVYALVHRAGLLSVRR